MSPSAWHYRRPVNGDGLVEWGDVHGRDVALPSHFHDEDQVTVVLAGRRRFRLAGACVALGPGDAIAVPAGTVHGSLPEPGGVLCRNAYVAAGTIALSDLVVALGHRFRRHDGLDEAAFAELLAWHRLAEPRPAPILPALDDAVTATAARRGMSREGFSRAFRRRHGLSPQPFRALMRLNAARRLLRAGVAPAAVAADTGFADQSHFGRDFRRAFGVTPARYRAGLITSVPDAGDRRR